MINRRHLQQSRARVQVGSSAATDSSYIAGYAALYHDPKNPGSSYPIGPDIEERIRFGAFRHALITKQNVRALFNHDSDNLLATVASGTLRLYSDLKGLRYEIDVNLADPDHVRVVEKIKRGDLTGSSFAFLPTRVSWEKLSDGKSVRWIENVHLFDVGPVTSPAYAGTSTELSSASELSNLREEEKEAGLIACDWRSRLHKIWQMESDYDMKMLTNGRN